MVHVYKGKGLNLKNEITQKKTKKKRPVHMLILSVLNI